jgi:hypothetical protein
MTNVSQLFLRAPPQTETEDQIQSACTKALALERQLAGVLTELTRQLDWIEAVQSANETDLKAAEELRAVILNLQWTLSHVRSNALRVWHNN